MFFKTLSVALTLSTALFSTIPNYSYVSNLAGNFVSVINGVDNSFVTNLQGSPYNFDMPFFIVGSPDRKQIWVSDVGPTNSITVFSSEDYSFIAKINYPSFSAISYILFSLDGTKAYICNSASGSIPDNISVIRTSDFSLIQVLDSGYMLDGPDTMMLSSDGSTLFVKNVTSIPRSLSVINTADDSFITNLSGASYQFGTGQMVAVNNLLFSANRENDSVTIFSSLPPYAPVAILNTPPYAFNSPNGIGLSNDQAALYVCNGGSTTVSVLNPNAPFNILTEINGFTAPNFISFDAFSSKAYVGGLSSDLFVLDTATNTNVANFNYGFMLPALATFNRGSSPPQPQPQPKSTPVPACNFLFRTRLK